MPVYIPGTENLYEAGLDNLIQATLNRNAVISGCQVVAHAAPDMGVRVSAGTIQGGGLRVTVAQTDLTVAANPGSNSRIDLVSVNFTSGVPTITAGTAGTGKPPSMPVTDILLAFVSVPAAAVNIQNANISDRRLYIPAADAYPYAQTVNPNLVLNGDLSRRTATQTLMPERFTDATGFVVVAGAAPSVASNIVTSTAANELAWCNQSFVWRDGRASATFKAVATNGYYRLRWRVGANDFVEAGVDAAVPRFQLLKVIGGAQTIGTTQAISALTLNRWYWIEIEKMGTTFIAKMYDALVTTPGTTKASSTLLWTITWTVADAAVQAGAHISVISDQTTQQWGGLATGDGGVYVEAINSFPESLVVTFVGTLGGQAIGINEAIDSGGPGKQSCLVTYIPAASRAVTAYYQSPPGAMQEGTSYTASGYMKVAGKGGSGTLANFAFQRMNLTPASVGLDYMSDLGETVFTRKTVTKITETNTRMFKFWYMANTTDGVSATTATGTASWHLAQIEQGTAVTAWRNAPADDGPLVWAFSDGGSVTTTSATNVDLASATLYFSLNAFLPWDAKLRVDIVIVAKNSAAGNTVDLSYSLDGVDGTYARMTAPVAAYNETLYFTDTPSLAAGKHRIAARWKTSAGTATLGDGYQKFIITATRGK